MRGYAIGAIVLLAGLSSSSQTTERQHPVVLEINTGGEGALNWTLSAVDELRSVLGPANTTVELVAHGQGLGFVSKDLQLALQTRAKPSALQARMTRMAEEGVTFVACETSMKAKGVKREDLLPFVRTVDSALAEVVRKQEEGWSYIKASY